MKLQFNGHNANRNAIILKIKIRNISIFVNKYISSHSNNKKKRTHFHCRQETPTRLFLNFFIMSDNTIYLQYPILLIMLFLLKDVRGYLGIFTILISFPQIYCWWILIFFVSFEIFVKIRSNINWFIFMRKLSYLHWYCNTYAVLENICFE